MKKKNWLLLVLALISIILLAACTTGGANSKNTDNNTETSDSGSGEASGKQVLNILESAQIPTMDSAHATDSTAFQYLSSTMEGLYRLGPDAMPVEGIAEGNPEISEDGLTWNIKLREDAVWSNGDSVTAHDFVFAWRRAINPETGSEYGPFMMNGILANATAINEGEADVEELGVKAVSDYELEITLEKQVPYFHSLLTFTTYLPQNEAFVTEQGINYALNSDNLVYNGPFVLENWDPAASEQWTLTKNEDYWDTETVQLEQINVDVVKETSTGVSLYDTGETDRAVLASEYVEQYADTEDYRTIPEPTLSYLKMNQANEALANSDIRKAIAMSIEKQSIVDVILADGSIVSNGAVPQDFTVHPETEEDFREINGDLLTENKEQAQKHWQAGLEALGTDTVELRYLGGDTETATEMDAAIKHQLESNLEGLTINISSVPFEEHIARNAASDYDIQYAGWGPDYLDPSTWLNMWTSDSPYMTMNYSNDTYDALINEANTDLLGADQQVERYENFLEAEKILMEDAAIAPIYQRSRAYLWRPSVHGVHFNPMGADFSYKWAYIKE